MNRYLHRHPKKKNTILVKGSMREEYQILTGVWLSDSFTDKKKLYHYELLREQFTFEQLHNMQSRIDDTMCLFVKSDKVYRHYKISDMDESVIVAHIKEINKKNGFPSYERQFKKQAKSIMEKYELGQIRYALHRAENMKLENEISFTFIERLIENDM